MNIKGWICPKCGNVYAPSVEECPRCNPLDFPDISCNINQDNDDFTDDEMVYCLNCGKFYRRGEFHCCCDNAGTINGYYGR